MNSVAEIETISPERSVLDAADRLYYERGIAAVSMSEIRDSADVSMRRLYMLYPSKRDLVAAWLSDRHLRWMTWFTEAVDRHVCQGADPVLATFDALEEWVSSPEYRGCAFINSIAESAEIDDSHRGIISNHKRELIAYIAGLTEAAHPGSPPWLSDVMGVLIDGAIVQSAIFKTTTPVVAARAAATSLIGKFQ